MANVSTLLPALQPVDVSADDREGIVDGVTVAVSIVCEPDEPGVGFRGGYSASVDCSTAKLADRAEWDAAHPGVEPTPAVVRALVEAAANEIAEAACGYAEAHPPERDFDDYGGDAEWGG